MVYVLKMINHFQFYIILLNILFFKKYIYSWYVPCILSNISNTPKLYLNFLWCISWYIGLGRNIRLYPQWTLILYIIAIIVQNHIIIKWLLHISGPIIIGIIFPIIYSIGWAYSAIILIGAVNSWCCLWIFRYINDKCRIRWI